MPFTNHIHDNFWAIIPQRMEAKKIHHRLQSLGDSIAPYIEDRVAECTLEVLYVQASLTKEEVELQVLRGIAVALSQRTEIHPRFREQCVKNLGQIQEDAEKFAPLAVHLPNPNYSFPGDKEFQRANNGVSGATFLRKGLEGERYVIKFQDLDQTEIEFLSTDLYRRIVSAGSFPIPMAAAHCCFPSLPDNPARKLSTAKGELHRRVVDDKTPLGKLSLLQVRRSFINHRESPHSHDNQLVESGLPSFFKFMPGTTFLSLCQRSASRPSHISTLSPQTIAKMFYQFGYIGGIDFLFGNFDRFLPRGFGEEGVYYPSAINGGNILLDRDVDFMTGQATIESISLIDNTPAFRIFFSTITNPTTGEEQEGRVVLRRKFTLFVRGNHQTLESLARKMFQELASEVENKDPITGRHLKELRLQPFIFGGLQRARWDLSSARVLNQCANFFRGVGDVASEKGAIFLGFLRRNVDDLIEIHHQVASYSLRLGYSPQLRA